MATGTQLSHQREPNRNSRYDNGNGWRQIVFIQLGSNGSDYSYFAHAHWLPPFTIFVRMQFMPGQATGKFR